MGRRSINAFDVASVRIDGVPHDCGPHRAVGVTIALDGPGQARFAVDGAEVPSRRRVVAGTDRVETAALLPAPVRFPRCGDGMAHRYDVLTTTPQGCRWTVASQQTQEEARGHQWALQESGTGCTLVLAPG